MCVERNFHNRSKTIRTRCFPRSAFSSLLFQSLETPRWERMPVINGNAASDRAPFAHRENPATNTYK